jgi:murein DD-endopeptidase MepM/ murein hydrolase activator NlpD
MRRVGRRVAAAAVAGALCVVAWVAPATAATQTPTAPAPTPTTEPSPTPSPSPPPVPTPPASTSPASSTTAQPAAPTSPAAPPTSSVPADVPEPAEPQPAPGDHALNARAHDVMSAHSMAVVDAETALRDALADLAAAEAALAKAQAEVQAARTALEAAQTAVAVAKAEETRVRQQLADILAQITDIRDDLGAVARDAYQGNTLATLSVALDANTPDEYADNYFGVRTVLRAGDAALGELAVQRADLVNARQQLTALRKEKEDLAVKAAEALKASEAAVEAAATAQRELSAAAQNRATALEAALRARELDYQLYREFLAEAQALRPWIVEMSGLLATSRTTLYGTGSFVRPGTGTVTSEFGIRRHPITGVVKLHTGVDIAPGDGFVYAADAGTVVKAEWNKAYGNMTVIDHGNGVTTLYAHQANMFAKVGDTVVKGARIGVVGSTGYSTGPHLHFEIRQDGEPIDPWPLIAKAPLPSLAG